MNWDRIQGNWKQVTGRAKEQWGKLTDDDLDVVAGALGLAYGSFSYTKETHQAKIGPIELSVKDKQTVNVPVWAGVGAIVLGGLLLVLGGRRN